MMINACQKVAEILLVEDNPVDVMVAQDALTEAKMCNKVHVAEDGEEALDFLYRRGKYVDAPRPDLILLDLNLPKKSGTDVLAEIKQDPSLLDIPVVILNHLGGGQGRAHELFAARQLLHHQAGRYATVHRSH